MVISAHELRLWTQSCQRAVRLAVNTLASIEECWATYKAEVRQDRPVQFRSQCSGEECSRKIVCSAYSFAEKLTIARASCRDGSWSRTSQTRSF